MKKAVLFFIFLLFAFSNHFFAQADITSSPSNACEGSVVTLGGTDLTNGGGNTDLFIGGSAATPTGTPTATSVQFTVPAGPYGTPVEIVIDPVGALGPDTVFITFDENPDATFSYPSTPYCIGDGTDNPSLAGGNPGGTTSAFAISAGPAGPYPWFNTSTGAITPRWANGPPVAGSYTIEHTATNGACSDVSTTPITINPHEDATFDYSSLAPGYDICVGTTPATVTVGALPSTGGGTWSVVPGAGLPVNGTTGEITTTGATPGSYTITYTTAGVGNSCDSVYSQVVDVYDKSTAFHYNTPGETSVSFCENLVGSVPCNITGTDHSPPFVITCIGGGCSTGADLDINTTSGELTPSNSVPGDYLVTANSTGPCAVTHDVTVTILPADDPSFNWGGTDFCQSVSDTLPSFAESFGSYTVSCLSGACSVGTDLNWNATNGSINPSASTSGIYQITHLSGGACPETSSPLNITILPTPNAAFWYGGGGTDISSISFCEGAVAFDSPTYAVPADSGTFSYTSAGGTSHLELDLGTGLLIPDSSDVDTFYILHTSTGGTCATTQEDTVVIESFTQATLAYPAATFCILDDSVKPTVFSPTPGTFTTTDPITLNSTTGNIDFTTSTAGGPYEVVYIPPNPACGVNDTATITINNTTNGSLSYMATTYCPGPSFPTPASATPASGTFSSQPGLVVNSSSGAIDLFSSSAGTFNVYYTPPGTCTLPDSVAITVEPKDTGYISYPSPTFCILDSPVLPDSIGTTGGAFSELSGNTGIDLNGITGEIDPGNSTPGSYTIKYVSPGNCPDSSTFSVSITNTADPTFNYPDTAYCTTDLNPVPIISGDPGGTFTESGGDIIFTSASSGIIDLSASTVGGPYDIVYTTPGTCAASDTFQVEVLVTDDPGFSYPQSTYCFTTTPNPTPTANTGGGTYSEATGNVDVNPTTGEIVLLNSTPGGPYVITYTTAGNCPDQDTVQITINGSTAATFTYNSGDTYCVTDNDPTPTISGVGGGVFGSNPGGLDINSSSGEIDVSNSAPGNYQVTYTPPGTCVGSVPDSIYIVDVDTTHFAYTPNLVCQSFSGTVLPTISGRIGGYFYEPTGNLDLDSLTGIITPDSSIAGGAYLIYYDSPPPCGNTSVDTVWIVAQDDGRFDYRDSVFCKSENDPTPLILGTGGGYFTGSPGTMIIDSTTGTIDLQNTPQDTFDITYTTVGVCPDTVTVTTSVLAQGDAGFGYGGVDFCSNTMFAFATITGDTGGVFSIVASDTTVFMDSLTGTIDLLQSINPDPQDNKNSVTIRYAVTGPANGCPASSTESINIITSDTASIEYGNIDTTDDRSHFCFQTTPFPRPQVTGDTTGRFVAISPGLFIANQGTGAIDLNQTLPSNQPYIVQFTSIGAVCNAIAYDTIFVDSLDESGFFYDDTEYCNTDTFAFATITGMPGGLFSENTGSLVYDDSTGTIDLLASNEGSYYMRYTTNGNCPNTDSNLVSVLYAPPIVLVDDQQDSVVCYGERVEFIATGALPGISFVRYSYGDGGLIKEGSDRDAPRLAIDSLPVGDVEVFVTVLSTNGCAAVDSSQWVVNPIPDGNMYRSPETMLGGTAASITVQAQSNQTQFEWSMISRGNVSPDVAFGSTIIVDSTDTVLINRPTVTLTDDLNPATLFYVIRPLASGCYGPPIYDTIQVNPNGLQFFIPGVITPNGNGKNDFWVITYDENIDPYEYYVEVYNRSGGLVYTLPSLDQRWYATALADGTYWYLLRRASDDGIEQRGGLRIKRD